MGKIEKKDLRWKTIVVVNKKNYKLFIKVIQINTYKKKNRKNIIKKANK